MADVFLPAALMYGMEYQQKNYVLNIRLSDGLLKARVKGSSGQIHDVFIDLKSWPGKPAQCNCRQAVNCEHAAASLYSLQAKEDLPLSGFPAQKSSQEIQDWKQTLSENQPEAEQDTSFEIAYLLDPQFTALEHRVMLRLAVARKLKRGGLGKKIIFNVLNAKRRQFFDGADKEIIDTLALKYGNNNWFDYFIVRNSELLEKILLTGRVWFYPENDEPALEYGSPADIQLCWKLDRHGSQQLRVEIDGGMSLPLLLDKPWFYDKDYHTLGLLNTDWQSDQFRRILSMPSLTLEEAAQAADTLSEDLPKPAVFADRIRQELLPQPVLCLDAIPLHSVNQHNIEYLYVMSVAFDYKTIRVAASDDEQSVFYAQKNTLYEMTRDRLFEKNKEQECLAILPVREASVQEKISSSQNLKGLNVLVHYRIQDDLERLYAQVIPLLKSKGWLIEFQHIAYQEVIVADEADWFSDIQETGNDFFSYQLGILVDEQPVNIVPLVAELISKLNNNSLEALSDDDFIRLPLPDGRVLQIAVARVKPLIRFLLQYGMQEQSLHISRYQILLMQETELALAAATVRWRGGETLRHQLQKLVSMNGIEVAPLPKGLQAVLRDYQHQGLSWLQFLRSTRFGGILADDMGLGKTIQTLAHMQLEKEQGRLKKASLVVAPTSLVGNWQLEAQRFTPELKILVFHGLERHQDSFDDYDLVISTYGIIQRDKTRFVEYPFYYLILDEAQFIKNARALTTQVIQQINAEHRLCLSGTPLENHLGELWSLFHFLMPGLLGDARQFRKFFKIPIEKNMDLAKRSLLANRVKPFMLRRNKNQVVKELPQKTEITRMIELSGPQRDLYEAIRMSMEKKVRDAIARRGIGKSHIILLDALLKLRQVCCDPRLLSLPEAQMAHGASAKLEALMELLHSLMSEGRRVLIFSQFTSMLALIEERLHACNYDYLKLTGQTLHRQQLVNTFQEGNKPIFLISLKAGGTGLNLTRADTVIHYDPWWNPAVEDQATDRSHRIGQDNPVFVYKLIGSGTVEEAILAMQKKKRQLIDGILSEQAGGIMALTAHDVEAFFKPLKDEL